MDIQELVCKLIAFSDDCDGHGEEEGVLLGSEELSEAELCESISRCLSSKLESINFRGCSVDVESRNGDDDDDDDEQFLHTKESKRRRSSLVIEGTNLRSIIGHLSSNDMADFTERLIACMSRRIDTVEELNPSLMNTQANEAVLSGEAPAITLTRDSLAAATVYAQMAALPGALGSGLIHMQALSALIALLRRWKVEITATFSTPTTAELSSSSTNAQEAGSSKRSHGRLRNSKTRKKRLPQSPDSDTKPKSKRSRFPENAEDDDWFQGGGNHGEPYGLEDELEIRPSSSSSIALSSKELLTKGLQLAKEVASLSIQREFMSWSSEARECIIEAITLVLFASSALGQTVSKRNNNLDKNVIELAIAVQHAAAESLERCILIDNGNGGSTYGGSDAFGFDETPLYHTEDLTKLHETTVAILRGLYPAICMKEELPNGEQGRQLASYSASRVLATFLREVVDDVQLNKSRWPASMQNNSISLHASSKPSSDSRDSLLPALTPATATPKSTRKPRTPTSAPLATPPRIKVVSKTPRTVPRSVTFAASSAKDKSLTSPTGKSRSPRFVFSAFVGILQKLATDKNLERSAARSSAVTTLHKCVQYLPPFERTHVLKFLIQLSYSKVSVHRLVAAEAIGVLLVESWLWPNPPRGAAPKTPSGKTQTVRWTPLPEVAGRRKSLSPLVNQSNNNMPAALLGALQGRISDRVPTVRAASISAIFRLVKTLTRQAIQEEDGSGSGLDGILEALSEEAFPIVCDLRVRASLDDKSLVRKAAIEALTEIIILAEASPASSPLRSLLTENDIEILTQRCKDPSVITRKAAAEALTQLLEQCIPATEEFASFESFESLVSAWTSSVLPMTLNAESSVASKAFELVSRAVVRPLLHGSSGGPTRVSWMIFATLGGGPQRNRVSRIEPEAMRKAIASILETEISLLKSLLQVICTVAGDRTSSDDIATAGAWSLCNALVNTPHTLKCIPGVVKRNKIDLTFLCGAWEQFLQSLSSSSRDGASLVFTRRSMQHSINVMAQLAPCLDPKLAGTTKARIFDMLGSFAIPPEVIGPAIAALTSLTIAEQPSRSCDEHKEHCSDWVKQLFDSCENELTIGCSKCSSESCEKNIVRSLCTIGEISMVGFSPTEEDGSKEGDRTAAPGVPAVQLVTGLRVPPTKKVVDLVQLYMGKMLPCDNESVETPLTVRAHALLAFGRFCLRDFELAKNGLNILARELHENMSSGCATIQSNALLTIGDLCVKYTNLVDRHLPIMAACLQSGVTDINVSIMAAPTSTGFAAVRKSAVILLSGLIIQDYIKWRGLLFHRFLVATTDEDDEVSDIAEAFLSGPLAMKQPKLFFNHFVESFFVLNCCTAHPMYVAAASSGDGGSGIAVGFDGINLKGEAAKVRRIRMYELMLSKMSDQEKLEATGRISKEILGGALVEGSELYRACTNPKASENVYTVLSDALNVMTSPLIRVGKTKSSGSSNSGGAEEEEEIEDPNVPNPVRRKAVAMGRLLSNISRKQMVESVLPVLCHLKTILQKHCSPLLRDLMAVMVDMSRLYKTEVHEFLANDTTLLQEIEYDVRRYQRAKNQQAATNSSTPSMVGAVVCGDGEDHLPTESE